MNTSEQYEAYRAKIEAETLASLRTSSLGMFLSLTVPKAIGDMLVDGGPTEEDLKRATEFVKWMTEEGDAILRGDAKKGVWGDAAAKMARGIALLAFSPGGVTLYGQHWDARHEAKLMGLVA